MIVVLRLTLKLMPRTRGEGFLQLLDLLILLQQQQ
jgi:hypothetical protein